ncbi:uncharacterized protein LOC114533559 [Dendronephthya gigantea]|uniref:uncharacterized protein LOC114533559 n=1 Tax=Dendronephthya gigantea TaxID=151771 RepID=UPI00106BC78B|nr:uncharacterized protein LOC114533559 [Dendronephthya gigantea]
MEDVQSLNFDFMDNEFSFESSFESYNKESQTREEEINNNIENNETAFQNPTSNWMGDILFGNKEELECVSEEISSEGLPSKSGSEDLCLDNWLQPDTFAQPPEHRPVFPHNQASTVNDAQVIADDPDFAFTNSLDLALKEGVCTPNQKVTESLTNSDEIDSFVEKFHKIDENVLKGVEGKTSIERTHFGEVKRRRPPEMEQKHKNKKPKLNVSEFNTKNSESAISTKTKDASLCTVGRRRRGRSDTKSRSRRSAQTSFGENSTSSPAAEVPSLSPVNPNAYFDDEELIALDTKELNLRVKYLPKKIVNEIKHRRRTLKNRGYARSCREKKIDETTSLQENNSHLEKELAGTGFELHLAKLQRDEWRKKYETLISEIKKRGIKVEA